jgi:Eukaryotic mitochondrial regulator protein
MPPTLRCSPSLPSTCAKKLCRAAQSTRAFSTTPPQDQRVTRNRRRLFRWLGSQGQNFLNPLSGSTNYLGAYNASGQLKRVVEAAAEAEAERKKKEGGKARDPTKADTSEFDAEGASGFKGEIPPETTRDLTPFPLNRNFISQPVLSDELREEIWKRVMKDGKSVREVSAELTVEMSRVGAVVRLKEIEKEWEQIVSPTNVFLLSTPL